MVRRRSNGIMTSRLEQRFADIFQSKYAISFINGTATMHTILAAAGVGAGDEVIVPPLTMASTALAVLHANATPVFADIDPDVIVGGIVRLVAIVGEGAGIVMLLYGIGRKIGLKKWN